MHDHHFTAEEMQSIGKKPMEVLKDLQSCMVWVHQILKGVWRKEFRHRPFRLLRSKLETVLHQQQLVDILNRLPWYEIQNQQSRDLVEFRLNSLIGELGGMIRDLNALGLHKRLCPNLLCLKWSTPKTTHCRRCTDDLLNPSAMSHAEKELKKKEEERLRVSIFCPYCGTRNRKGMIHCVQCRWVLP